MGIDLIDMGQIDDEERPFMIVDKDTGHVYDIRRPDHIDALTNQQSVRSTSMVGRISAKSNTEKPSWNSWWEKKRKNNNDYLNAAEGGYLQLVKDLLDVEMQKDLVADLNCKGPDSWHALHFAANEGKIEVIEFLLSKPKIDVSPLTKLKRTPLHLAASRGYSLICKLLCDTEKVNIDA